MKLAKKPKLMLFALYQFYKEVNKKLQKRPLSVVIPKTSFIRLVRNAGITETQPRAIYKNLEILEKRKLIKYDARELKFTRKGLSLIKKIDNELGPYLEIIRSLKKRKHQKIVRKHQTIFK